MPRTLDDLTPRGADRLIGWVKGTMNQDDAQGEAVRAMVAEFLAHFERHDPRSFNDSKPEAAQPVAA